MLDKLSKAGFSPALQLDSVDCFIPTGVLELDLALGTGGLPAGYLTTIFGPSGVTKSTLLYYLLNNCFILGGIPILFDQEFNFQKQRHEKYGLDPSGLLVKQDVSLEQLSKNFSSVLKTIKSYTKQDHGFAVLVLDSFSATLSESEVQSGAPSVGLHSRVLRFLCRSFLSEVFKSRVALVFVAQETQKIGVTFGATHTFLAKGGLESNSFVVMRMQRRSTIKSEEGSGAVGIRVKATITKNKFARPMREVEYDFFFDSGIDRVGSVCKVLTDKGIIKKTGSWYSIDGLKFQGLKSASGLLQESEEFKGALRRGVSECFEELGLEVPPYEVYGL